MAREKWRTARREDLSGACCPCQCVSAELRLPTAGVRGGKRSWMRPPLYVGAFVLIGGLSRARNS